MKPLDLYAHIEPLIGFYEEYEELYQRYLSILDSLHVKKVLDIGCGNGKFLRLLRENAYEAEGIERSQAMLEIASSLDVQVSSKELNDFEEESFEAAVAIGDVLNYMDEEEIKDFFLHVKRVLSKGGYFIADINTLDGFEIADGVILKHFEDKVLSIEASFEEDKLNTHIEYFEKDKNEYKRSSGNIIQYYHPKSFFKKIKDFSLQKNYFHSMFSEFDEKEILVFQKR